jgi:hypothetical protein
MGDGERGIIIDRQNKKAAFGGRKRRDNPAQIKPPSRRKIYLEGGKK